MDEVESLKIDYQRASVYFLGGLSSILMLLQLLDRTTGLMASFFNLLLYIGVSGMLIVGGKALKEARGLRIKIENNRNKDETESTKLSLKNKISRSSQINLSDRFSGFLTRNRLVAAVSIFFLCFLILFQFHSIEPNLYIDNTDTGGVYLDSANNFTVSDTRLTSKPRGSLLHNRGVIFNFTFEHVSGHELQEGVLLIYFDQEIINESISCRMVFENKSVAPCHIEEPSVSEYGRSPLQIEDVSDRVENIHLRVASKDYNFGHLELSQKDRIYDSEVIFEPRMYKLSDVFIESNEKIGKNSYLPNGFSARLESRKSETPSYTVDLRGKNSFLEFLKFIISSVIGGLFASLILFFKE